MERIMKKLCLILVFSSLLVISGCSEKTSDEYIALAETNIQQNDIPSAIIELKNSVRVNPQDPKSRFMLGDLYAGRGSAAAAEKELILAFELGYEPNEVLPVLANAYSLQFKHAEIIKLVDESRNLAPEVETSLLLYQALAYFQINKPAKAKQSVNLANEISADSIYSKLGRAYVSFSEKQIDDSIEKVDELLEQTTDFPEAILLKAQLATINKDYSEAVKNFEAYDKLLPSLLQSKLFLANGYIKNKQFDESENILDKLLKINKSQPFINQLKGFVRYEAKDYEGAKLYTEIAIQNGMDNATNRVVAGISSFQVLNYEQAYQHLTSIEDQIPNNHPIKKLITIVKLKLGYSVDSADELSTIQELTERDMILLSAVSKQLVQSGNLKRAQALFEKTEEITFTDPLRIAQKGLLRLSLEDLEGISDLENALALDPELEIAKIGLAVTYIENGYYDQAIVLANNWINEEATKLNGYVLYATALLGKNEISKAEEMYSLALEVDSANPAANIYFADKAESQNQTTEAIAYLETILKGYPTYLPALKKYFVLQTRLGNSEEGLNAFETALSNNQGAEKLTLLYAQAFFTAQRYQETIDILAKMEPSDTYPDVYWIIMADSYFNLGEMTTVLDLSKKWVEILPENRVAHLRLITFYELSGNISQARTSAKNAFVKFKNDNKFAVLLTYFNVLMDDLSAAQQSFDSLSDDAKLTLAGQWVEGLIQLESGNPEAALPKLQKYYDKNPSDQNAIFVAKALNLQRKFGDSIAFLKQHLNQSSSVIGIRIRIAEVAINNGDFEEAKEQYLAVLELDKDNFRALNNLANIFLEQNNATKALPYVERAAELKPNTGQILDTYASILSKLGRIDEALENYARAYKADPTAIEIGIRYAQAMISNNQNERAMRILNSLKTKDPELQLKISDLSKSI
jgi:putative PEP-CTERM system TPR-repeat lipoprotein